MPREDHTRDPLSILWTCFFSSLLNHCVIMNDLALLPYSTTPFPAFEDISVVSIVVNVGSSTTLHWKWKYEAWQRELVSAFTVDLITNDGTVTHIVKPIAAPPGRGALPPPTVTGPYRTGQYTNDFELARFWPNQKVTLRFILRNTYDPAYINWLYTGYTVAGLDAAGLSDVGMAKVIIEDLHISNDTCPVAPLLPIAPDAQPFEDYAQGARDCTGLVDLGPMQQPMLNALSCLQQAVANAGGQLIITSAFRPVSYQSHLYDLYQKYLKLLNNTDPACAERRAQVIDEVNHVHCIQRSGAAKGDAGQHPKGGAFDLSAPGVNLIQLACGCGLYRPYPEDGTGPRGVIDRPHYQITPAGAVCK
jgi:hypothetical protein